MNKLTYLLYRMLLFIRIVPYKEVKELPTKNLSSIYRHKLVASPKQHYLLTKASTELGF